MPIEKLMTFVCFGLWALASLFVFGIAALRPHVANVRSRKMDYSNPCDLAMLIALGSWLAMWCFRSMY